MSPIASIILAAGKGVRMKSDLPKVLHPIAGFPLVYYPIKRCEVLKIKPIKVVVSPSNEKPIRETLKKYDLPALDYALQNPPLGTGHAVMIAFERLKKFKGDILILYGDMPLVQSSTLRELIKKHQKQKNALTFITSLFEKSSSYGRVLRTPEGKPCGIVEFKDATPAQKNIREINTGIYLISSKFLKESLSKLKTKNVQKEYYLTDLISIAFHHRQKIGTLTLEDLTEGLGINTQEELMEASKILMKKKIQTLLSQGVKFSSIENIIIDSEVKIGEGTSILAPCTLLGKTTLGENCSLEPGAFIRDSIIANEVKIKAYSYLDQCKVGDKAQIGPFAHLRPASILESNVKIGNFVELKKSKIGKGSKVNHLSYIGDAILGKHVNVGAGTITCNYDGTHKYQTILEDNVFVGSDTQFVAPVRVKKGAFIGAGSTITKNVKSNSLALSRTKQTEIENWALKRTKKKEGSHG